jgi:hypothetical protein
MERNREIPTMHLRDNFYGDKSRFVEQHVSNSAIGTGTCPLFGYDASETWVSTSR